MGEVSTIGVDLAKSVFQVHGADASGAVLFRRVRLMPFELKPAISHNRQFGIRDPALGLAGSPLGSTVGGRANAEGSVLS
jgi:hypothetical protein